MREIEMVLVVSKFEQLKEHAEYMSSLLPRFNVFFQVFPEGTEKEKVKIIAGRLGYEGEYTEEIRKWLESVSAIEISGAIDDELFFIKY
ncbi:MAG: hypothetical protein JTT12_05435 [Candidatus Brockarchaeota archaeon]|nr:hypothetical protein [Candidatus Brockarchaeota archaeon]